MFMLDDFQAPGGELKFPSSAFGGALAAATATA